MIAYWKCSFREANHSRSFQNFFNAFKNIPPFILFFFTFFCLVCLYSLYIGTFNAENDDNPLSIHDRYVRLPAGLYYLFTRKLGLPLLTVMIFLNAFLIRRIDSTEAKRIISLLKWIAIFCIIYVLLLPIGGYRNYRPNIIRYDTMIPVTICMIFMYGYSTYFLLKQLSANTAWKRVYALGIVLVSLIFTTADKPTTGKNTCEKKALEQIVQSKEKIVHLTCDCTVMAWVKITDYHGSEANAELLKYLGILKEKKFYYQD